ncbi:MAG: hypothetical protein KJ568_01930 [Actinobacteria bacterium]|nr:hypothetical protein [Actinomycetota bacterium]
MIIFLLGLVGNAISTIGTLGGFAQNTDSTPKTVPRTVLVELFIQEGCTTCPTAEFCMEDLAWEYGATKLILVEEHLWGDGYDTPETNARYDWYVGDGKRGTPDVFIDGLTKRLQGLSCDCIEGNYECYKDAIDEELTRPSLLEISAIKTPHPNPLPQGEREKGEESPQGEREKEGEDNQVVEETKGEDKEVEFVEEKVANIIIEGTVKNVSDTPLKDLAVCGMVGKEGDESGLYNYIQDIFPFQDMPPLLPGTTFNFKFIPEILLTPESEIADKKEILHLVIFVQNTITKEILQVLYIE